ncbi:DUF5376 domain-containing protein [Ralstonia pseudosolanacearum]|uniref:DUF5376 domain-containing protein n=1 Tax=Ralstonia pseudosolanacearum TaxID=1310165 RepID=UPI001FFB0B7F|nr:DUF5376 domain-containing protein [Ralstonia pseudosolanacearum]
MMKLKFSWESELEDGIIPFCESSVVKQDGVSPLACLLMDDGGRRYLDTFSWIDEGIARIYAAIKDEAVVAIWGREAWEAKISSGGVKVYSLYDEEYSEMLTISMFLHALLAWKEFLQSNPELGVIREVDI